MATGYIKGFTHRQSAELTIYHIVGIATEPVAVPITPRSIRKFMLMQEDFIQLEFSLATARNFSIGDYVVDPIFGTFYITGEQMPKYNQTTGGYDYSLRFDADYMRWRQYIFMLVATIYDEDEDEDVQKRMEVDWKLTAPLSTHAEQIVANLNCIGAGYSGYSVNVSAANASDVKFLQYSGVNIIEAMNMIAEAWECEWWIDGNVINFGKCELDPPTEQNPNPAPHFTFIIGDNVESMDVARDQQTYANRIYAYGGTQNIPETYDRELVFTVTDNGLNGFKDNSRPMALDMIDAQSSVAQVAFVMDVTATPSGINPRSYSQKTDTKSLNNAQTIAGQADVTLTMESDDWAGSEYEPPIVSAKLVLHIGSSSQTISDFEQILPSAMVSIGGKTWRYAKSINTDITLTSATNVYIEVMWRVSFQANSQHTSDNVVFGNGGTNITATADSSAATKDITVYQYGSNTGRAAKFYGATGLIKFNSSTPSGWGVGSKYTLSPLTIKVPISYYSAKYDTEGMSAVGERRLHLPGSVRYKDGDSLYQSIIEMAVIFPDEYPKLELRIKNGTIGTTTKTDTIKHDDGSVTRENWTQYSFIAQYKDANGDWQDFNFKTDWMLDGAKLQAVFTRPQTINANGYKLSGMTFDLGFDERRFTIIRNEDFGASLPNEFLYPSNEDEFFITGWNPNAMSEMGLIRDAQIRLRDKVNSYLQAIKQGQFTFTCRMMSDIFWRYAYGGRDADGNSPKTYGLLALGARVTISNDALPGGSKTSRIIGYEYKLDIPYDTPTYVVGETEAFSRIKQIEKQLTKL